MLFEYAFQLHSNLVLKSQEGLLTETKPDWSILTYSSSICHPIFVDLHYLAFLFFFLWYRCCGKDTHATAYFFK